MSDASTTLVAAARLSIGRQFSSGLMLQRKLKIDSPTAARVLDELERVGVVGPSLRTRARQVLVAPDRMDEVIESLERDM